MNPSEIVLQKKFFAFLTSLGLPQVNLELHAFHPASGVGAASFLLNSSFHFSKAAFIVPEESVPAFQAILAPWAELGLETNLNPTGFGPPDSRENVLHLVNAADQESSLAYTKAVGAGSNVFAYLSTREHLGSDYIWTLMHPWWEFLDNKKYESVQMRDSTLHLFFGRRRAE